MSFIVNLRAHYSNFISCPRYYFWKGLSSCLINNYRYLLKYKLGLFNNLIGNFLMPLNFPNNSFFESWFRSIVSLNHLWSSPISKLKLIFVPVSQKALKVKVLDLILPLSLNSFILLVIDPHLFV